MLSEKS
jgi:hypothetical protein